MASTDPFSDHHTTAPSVSVDDSDDISQDTERDLVASATLALGRNATLTLGTDSLVLLDEGLYNDGGDRWCGLLGPRTAKTRSIPYHHILHADLTKTDITIHYCKPSGTSLTVAYLHYSFECASDSATKWTARLLSRAYPAGVQRQKRIKLLINPFGGTGRAQKLYTSKIEPILAAARCEVDVETTRYSGHAVEIAKTLDLDKFDVLACASGDGLPHECFNGLAQHEDPLALRRIAVTQLPCGSGNAFCWNFAGTGDAGVAALELVKGKRGPFDLASVTQGDKRTLSFLSQSIGIVAESDLGTENVRWMGEARFTYGFLVRLLAKKRYPCDIAIKEKCVDKREMKQGFKTHVEAMQHLPVDWEERRPSPGLPALEYGSIQDEVPGESEGWTPMTHYPTLGNFYCGNMCWMAGDAPFFPASLPSDGCLDLVTIDGGVSRMKQIEMLLNVSKNTFFDMPEVVVRKISAVRVIPKYGKFAEGGKNQGDAKKEGYFSVCGEKFPFEPFQIEVHQGIATVLCKRPGVYEGPGPAGWEGLPSRRESDRNMQQGQQEMEERARRAGSQPAGMGIGGFSSLSESADQRD